MTPYGDAPFYVASNERKTKDMHLSVKWENEKRKSNRSKLEQTNILHLTAGKKNKKMKKKSMEQIKKQRTANTNETKADRMNGDEKQQRICTAHWLGKPFELTKEREHKL